MSCGICDKVDEKIFDGICEDCEIIWENEVARLSKELPPETSIKELFHKASIASKEIYQKNLK